MIDDFKKSEISTQVHEEIRLSSRRIFKDYINYFSMESTKIEKKNDLDEPLCDAVERTMRNITGLMILDYIIKSQKEEDRAIISDYIKTHLDHFCKDTHTFLYEESDMNPNVASDREMDLFNKGCDYVVSKLKRVENVPKTKQLQAFRGLTEILENPMNAESNQLDEFLDSLVNEKRKTQ